MDILEALEETARSSGRLCRLGRWLANIDDDHPGKADLVATLTTTDPKAEHYRSLLQLEAILHRLGLDTAKNTLSQHRNGSCRCSA